MKRVTKEDVDKAEAEWHTAFDDDDVEKADARAAWDEYVKLWQEFEDGSGE